MAIPEKEKNIKLTAAPPGEPMAAVTALKKLKRKAKHSMVYSSDGNPGLGLGSALHLDYPDILVRKECTKRFVDRNGFD